ncbi:MULTISPECIES: NAD-dependent epimerase/dehydratase family protein [unclassified Nocardioides]|uniref:NAD-dependent epimerase/dehydratase family protein n=1 Tax=unclassified Nocardioides TaxID=2615069 RepID=UPI00114FA486|nr:MULTISPECIES: NAD-dependent epimerase/dehydratase family protein [unclassified Nocardioides]TQK69418.1 nucleoside-diphosphate-sugar epimerase [Nocardioides sp. SLBN-35]WGY01283.1 NAD-dependent epimerase/dehydratase family protein [Nocardioides sp. QY071]
MNSGPVDVLVAGGGGFIGGHLVADLLAQGKTVRSVDVKPIDEWYQVHPDAQNAVGDLSLLDQAEAATKGAREVYMLAADMGGMGFIENNKALCMLTVLTSTHMLQAAKKYDVERYFYSSSACVYAADKQTDPGVTALKESDAYPAMPEDGYGWEKLFTERMARHFREDFGLTTRMARYHNVYGPEGTWTGGREKAPAAVCRKIAEAVISGRHELEIWGDGEQTRSFMYIDDCVKGSQMILASDLEDPINLGSAELVSINQLYTIVEEIAGIKCERKYDLSAPQGVRGRNSDNTMINEVFGWEPSISLADGLAQTYAWVYDQVKRAQG